MVILRSWNNNKCIIIHQLFTKKNNVTLFSKLFIMFDWHLKAWYLDQCQHLQEGSVAIFWKGYVGIAKQLKKNKWIMRTSVPIEVVMGVSCAVVRDEEIEKRNGYYGDILWTQRS